MRKTLINYNNTYILSKKKLKNKKKYTHLKINKKPKRRKAIIKR
jgi:hypothetical protein